jgi:sec-independent protein translocase protein TatA
MMGGFSMVHWIILLAVILLFFGAGRLPNVMGDFAKGIKAFRAGMKEDDVKPAGEQAAQQTITAQAGDPAPMGQAVSGDRKAV